MLEIRPLHPQDPQFQRLLSELDALQSSLYPPHSTHLDPPELLSHLLGAFEDGHLLGCGGVKLMPGYGEIKRMVVSPAARGRGVGQRLLQALEALLVEGGLGWARLETGILQCPALSLYQRCGYRLTGPFGSYREDPNSVFLEKPLPGSGG